MAVKKKDIGINYNWDTTAPTLHEAMMNDVDQSICVVGPVGSAKSSFGVLKIIGLCQKYANDFPYTKWCVVRNSYRELQDTTMRTWFFWFPPAGYDGETFWSRKYKGTEFENITFGDYRPSAQTYFFKYSFGGISFNAEILFRSAEDGANVAKFRSLEIAGAHIDEASEVPKEVILTIEARVERYNPDWPSPIVILTTNPPNERHWIYNDYFHQEKKLKGHAGYKQKPGENAANLRPGYYDRLREKYANNPDWINRYINGDWGVILEGETVYPEFNSVFHVVDEPLVLDKYLPIVRGFDFGLTPACVFSQLQSNGVWYVFDELQEFNMGIDRFADKVVMHSNINYPEFRGRFVDFADPAGWQKAQTDERTCVQLMNQKGIYPSRGELSFTARREAVASYLNRVEKGTPAFKLYKKKCPILFDGFAGGYHYATNKDGIVITEKPVKNELSHLHDALQYAGSMLLSLTYGVDDWEPLDIAATYQVA